MIFRKVSESHGERQPDFNIPERIDGRMYDMISCKNYEIGIIANIL